MKTQTEEYDVFEGVVVCTDERESYREDNEMHGVVMCTDDTHSEETFSDASDFWEW